MAWLPISHIYQSCLESWAVINAYCPTRCSPTELQYHKPQTTNHAWRTGILYLRSPRVPLFGPYPFSGCRSPRNLEKSGFAKRMYELEGHRVSPSGGMDRTIRSFWFFPRSFVALLAFWNYEYKILCQPIDAKSKFVSLQQQSGFSFFGILECPVALATPRGWLLAGITVPATVIRLDSIRVHDTDHHWEGWSSFGHVGRYLPYHVWGKNGVTTVVQTVVIKMAWFSIQFS